MPKERQYNNKEYQNIRLTGYKLQRSQKAPCEQGNKEITYKTRYIEGTDALQFV